MKDIIFIRLQSNFVKIDNKYQIITSVANGLIQDLNPATDEVIWLKFKF
jgi:hypothetical protein